MQSVAKGGGCCAEIRRFGRRSCAPQLTGGLIMAAVRGAAAACSAWRIDARSLRGLRSIGFHLEQLMKLGRANGTKSGSDASLCGSTRAERDIQHFGSEQPPPVLAIL